jgi:hypothetical protein
VDKRKSSIKTGIAGIAFLFTILWSSVSAAEAMQQRQQSSFIGEIVLVAACHLLQHPS